MSEVRTYLGNMDPRSSRFPFVQERNGNIAEKIARYQGLSYNPEPLMTVPREKTYLVPGTTLSGPQRTKFLINGVEDFYGGMVSDFSHVGKAILHPAFGDSPPHFYDDRIKKLAERAYKLGLVLPGATLFSVQDALAYFDDHLSRLQPKSYRLKTTNDSDGEGQAAVESREHLAYLLSQHRPETVRNEGLVFESNLAGPKRTISVGSFFLGHDPFSFIADQKTGIGPDGRDIYLGADNVHVVRGGFDELHEVISGRFSPEGLHASAIEKTAVFDLHYRTAVGVLASRLSYDVLIGSDTSGKRVEGITDITARLGGTCSALMLGALDLQESPDHQAVVAQVNLNYQPQNVQDFEKGATIFMDQKPLRITAKIDHII